MPLHDGTVLVWCAMGANMIIFPETKKLHIFWHHFFKHLSESERIRSKFVQFLFVRHGNNPCTQDNLKDGILNSMS